MHPHPTDDGLQVRFYSLEGNEVGTYFRGSATLVGGVAQIVPPEDWRLVTAAEGITVHPTPKGAAVLWAEQESLDLIVIKGTEDVPFNYVVYGHRFGFESPETIEENTVHPIYRGMPYAAGFAPHYRQKLVDNGMLNADFTPNEEMAATRGWELMEPPPGFMTGGTREQ